MVATEDQTRSKFVEMLKLLGDMYQCKRDEMDFQFVDMYWKPIKDYDWSDIKQRLVELKDTRTNEFFPNAATVAKSIGTARRNRLSKQTQPVEPMFVADADQKEFNKLHTEWWKSYFGTELAGPINRPAKATQSELDGYDPHFADASRVEFVQSRLSDGNRFTAKGGKQ